jgi:hypothetical protein
MTSRPRPMGPAMKSFRMEKASGDQDVTHEALMWILVLLFVIVPLLLGIKFIFIG